MSDLAKPKQAHQEWLWWSPCECQSQSIRPSPSSWMEVTKCYYTPTDFISSLTECAVKYTIFYAKLRVKNHTKPCVISFYHISEHLNCMKLANHYTFFWFYQFTQTLWERILYILFLENFKNTKLHERTGTALFSSMNPYYIQQLTLTDLLLLKRQY